MGIPSGVSYALHEQREHPGKNSHRVEIVEISARLSVFFSRFSVLGHYPDSACRSEIWSHATLQVYPYASLTRGQRSQRGSKTDEEQVVLKGKGGQ